jgi:hypothetical protein
MATPVFKFNHPDLPDEDLYFIQNTFYELPATIPMDLTTFVRYHFATDRTFEGFFYCWDNLIKSGATLEDVGFETWFNEEEKSKLYQDASASSAILNAVANKITSDKIKVFIQEKKYEQENFESFFFDLIESSKDNYRGDDFYQSRHYLFHHFQTLIEENQPNYNEEKEPDEFEFEKKSMDDYEISGDFDDLFKLQYTLDDIDIHNFDEEELLISFYENENIFIPLHLIPHKFRNSGFFRDKCLNNRELYLIPLPINDREIILKAIKQNGIALKFATEELKNDREIVLEAVKNFGWSLEFASESLRNDPEIQQVANNKNDY